MNRYTDIIETECISKHCLFSYLQSNVFTELPITSLFPPLSLSLSLSHHTRLLLLLFHHLASRLDSTILYEFCVCSFYSFSYFTPCSPNISLSVLIRLTLNLSSFAQCIEYSVQKIYRNTNRLVEILPRLFRFSKKKTATQLNIAR